MTLVKLPLVPLYLIIVLLAGHMLQVQIGVAEELLIADPLLRVVLQKTRQEILAARRYRSVWR